MFPIGPAQVASYVDPTNGGLLLQLLLGGSGLAILVRLVRQKLGRLRIGRRRAGESQDGSAQGASTDAK